MQDPSCPDIAGRVLESLGHCGLTIATPSRACGPSTSSRASRTPSGGWWGRWGVNYIYGTWQVLDGPAAVGEDMSAPYIHRAADWLRSVQKPDGSFGETCASYEDPSLKGQGESTASPNRLGRHGPAWPPPAPPTPAVEKGVDWLIAHQAADGELGRTLLTGTGFPKVFYLNTTCTGTTSR